MPQADPAASAQVSPQEEAGIFIYDAIMSAIEPELVSTEIPKLEEKYKNETPEEKSARAKHYNAAFAAYEKHYAHFIAGVGGEVRALKHEAMATTEAEERAKEEEEMSGLESAISEL